MMYLFAFRPLQVAVWMIVLYVAFLIPSIVVHETVPPGPSNPDQPYPGVNVTEAWLDLVTLTKQFHPFASQANEDARAFLLSRIYAILDRNKVEWSNSSAGGVIPKDLRPTPNVNERSLEAESGATGRRSSGPAATVFSDTVSNVTTFDSRVDGVGLYFEGSNIIVYIRGTEDDDGAWWDKKDPPTGTGVLVNAHFDSVTTAYGASDDGIGVVTILQLISFFTTPGNQPRRGIVALLNNGEEDGLWGAQTFGYSPLMPFADSFLNLEGAGAGSQAMVFRTTDQEMAAAYGRSAPRPVGSVVASDGFRLGLIASDTDFSVWSGVYGMRGVDMAFYKPRARYHSDQDDAEHASVPSLWHMLDSSVKTVQELTGQSSTAYSGSGTLGVWFDTFNLAFALISMKAMLGWSIALLVATPIALAVVSVLLFFSGKYYLFAGSFRSRGRHSSSSTSSSTLSSINGWNGFFRYPIALLLSVLLVIIACYIVIARNPYIIYSNAYTVWAMCLSLFLSAFWALSRRASLARPTALQRTYAVLYLYGLSWVLLAVNTYMMSTRKIAAGYFTVVFHNLVFGAALVALLEFFALPRKSVVLGRLRDAEAEEMVPHRGSVDFDGHENGAAAAATEEMDGFIDGRRTNKAYPRGAAAPLGRKKTVTVVVESLKRLPKNEYGRWMNGPAGEEIWAQSLPRWTWLLQFIMIAPATIIFISSIGLLVSSAIAQTLSPPAFPILAIALFSILLLLPTTPFMHRLSWPLPALFLLISLGTFIFNLAGSPFNADNRYKATISQAVDLDTGASVLKLGGLERYVRPIIAALPSAAGKDVQCAPARNGNVLCRYDSAAVLPNITKALTTSSSKQRNSTTATNSLASWLTYNVSRTAPDRNQARFTIDAPASKRCHLLFSATTPVSSNFSVLHSAGLLDTRFASAPADGLLDEIKLWRRSWDTPWEVTVEWGAPSSSSGKGDGGSDGSHGELKRRAGTSALSGRVVCVWEDANVKGTIPALDEVFKFAPSWATVTKGADGLVEGSKAFNIA